MLHTLEKGEYPKGHRYWSNATGDLNAAFHEVADWLDSRCRFNE